MKKFIKELCLNAGEILLKYFGQNLEHREKKDAGFVTEADIESENYIINEIKKNYPESDIIAEESGENIKNNPLKWIIDPLDGTTNYGNGIPFFGISIALEKEEILTHGAIYNPVTKEFFYAEKDKGVWLNDNPIKVNPVKDLSKTVLATGDTYYRGAKFKKILNVINRMYEKSRVVRIPGSVALSLAYIGAGKIHGFWLEDFNYWDVAAGILMVREAGGIVVDFEGNDLEKGGGSSIIATSKFLLPELLKIISE